MPRARLFTAYGVIAGSLVIGIVAQVSTIWFPVELQNAWALLVLIVVLLVRPQAGSVAIRLVSWRPPRRGRSASPAYPSPLNG